MKRFPDNHFHAVVTDPPYELTDGRSKKGFMGKAWDGSGVAFDISLWAECLRVLRPGGYLLSFGGSRTYHRMACAIEDAGFILHPMIGFVQGQGFPKATNLSKMLDKDAGAEREVIGHNNRPPGWFTEQDGHDITAPATPEAKAWDGWYYGKQSLKPALEPICMAQKPPEGRMVDNIRTWGCGGVNIDQCRIGGNGGTKHGDGEKGTTKNCYGNGLYVDFGKPVPGLGRFPANMILGHAPGCSEGACVEGCPVKLMGEQSGISTSRKAEHGEINIGEFAGICDNANHKKGISTVRGHSDTGTAARYFLNIDPDPFFYCAKASNLDRNKGLDGIRTVKLITDDDLIYGTCKKDVNTVAVQLLQKVTSELMVKWNIGESGESISALCRLDSLSTTLTEINKITESRILLSLMSSLTNESTPGVNLSTVNGGSLAENVENLKEWLLTITNEKMELALGASRVALKMLSQTSEKESWQTFKNFHSTVKPLKLMRYLCRLITPPSGLILDPFAGSGTTLCAAALEGFDSVGIELNQEYITIADARLAAYQPSPDATLHKPLTAFS